MEHFHHTQVIAENLQISNNNTSNHVVIDTDGTLRCLCVPPFYFGLDDVVEGLIFCEQGLYTHLLILD